MFAVGLDALYNLSIFIDKDIFSGNELILNHTLLTFLRLYSTDKLPNNNIKEVIVGSLLGDADIEMGDRAVNGRFKITQSTKHQDYFSTLSEIFKEFCSSLP